MTTFIPRQPTISEEERAERFQKRMDKMRSKERKKQKKSQRPKGPSYSTVSATDWRPPLKPTADDSERTASFLDLVDCRQSEVIDTYERWGCTQAPTEESLREEAADTKIEFGKYEGYLLRDVPADYLKWALNVPKPKGLLKKLCRVAQAELARRERLHAAVS